MELPCNCPDWYCNFLQLPCSCSAAVLKLPCSCPAASLQLPCSCPAATLQLLCSCSAAALQLPCSCPAKLGAALNSHRNRHPRHLGNTALLPGPVPLSPLSLPLQAPEYNHGKMYATGIWLYPGHIPLFRAPLEPPEPQDFVTPVTPSPGLCSKIQTVFARA
jgi:hypothetical protein